MALYIQFISDINDVKCLNLTSIIGKQVKAKLGWIDSYIVCHGFRFTKQVAYF
jgi:hypothetical protein